MEGLETLPFWAALDDGERQLLQSAARIVRYRKGDVVYNGGDCLGIIGILEGAFCAYLVSDDGRVVTLYNVREGDECVLTNSCALSRITFDVHFDAEEDSTVLLIPPSAVARLKKNLHVENFIYKTIAERFSDVMWAMQQILFRRMDERVAGWLYDAGRQNGVIVTTHERIARELGSAREVVGRILKLFADRGLVRIGRGSVEILDAAELKKLAYAD